RSSKYTLMAHFYDGMLDAGASSGDLAGLIGEGVDIEGVGHFDYSSEDVARAQVALQFQRATEAQIQVGYAPLKKALASMHAIWNRGFTAAGEPNPLEPHLRGQLHVSAYNFKNHVPRPINPGAADQAFVDKIVNSSGSMKQLRAALGPGEW